VYLKGIFLLTFKLKLAVCLICHETVTVLKEWKLEIHFETKHAQHIIIKAKSVIPSNLFSK